MSTEIEAKMSVPDHGPVRERLRQAGARYVGKVLETNTIFDTGDRALLSADKGLRLRVARDLTSGDETVTLTFKGPRHPGPLKSRDEAEAQVVSALAARRLLEAMGYAKFVSFQKRRETWELDSCTIELDEVPHLGFYVEIEGPQEVRVMHVREALALTDRPLIKTSYISLLLGHLAERGLRDREVAFADA